MKNRIAGVIACGAAGIVLLGAPTAEASGELWESKGTNGVELLDPAAAVTNAMAIVKAVSNRVEWDVCTRDRCQRFVGAARSGSSDLGHYLDGFTGPSMPEEYVLSEGEQTTNVYLAAILLSREDAKVRLEAVEYLDHAIRRNLRYWMAGALARGVQVRFEVFYAGKHDPPWVRDVALPMLKRAMFDEDDDVRVQALRSYCRLAPWGMAETSVYASKNPSSAWAKDLWLFIYYQGLPLPTDILAGVKERLAREKTERDRVWAEADERYMRLRSAFPTNAYTGTLSLYGVKNGYEGEIKDGMANGLGTLARPGLGDWKYVGGWKNNQLWGRGTLVENDGKKYEGEWEAGLRHGQGTQTWGDGLKYVGGFKRGRFDGQGLLRFVDGTQYVGQWKDDMCVGQGTFTLLDGKEFVGDFKGVDAQGTMVYTDGSRYVGEWKGGNRQGKGMMKYGTRDGTYVGEWKDGKENGQGTLTGSSGRRYVGEWKDGKENGQGTLTNSSGRRYVGEWKDGKENGQGTMITSVGITYVGEWKDGSWNGRGTVTHRNGSKYEGEWKDGRRHGLGTQTTPEGSQWGGLWEDGEYLGPAPAKQTNAPPAGGTDGKP